MGTTARLRFLVLAAVCASAPGFAFGAPETQQVSAAGGAAGDRFGEAIDGDGATVVLGASLHDDVATDAGSAYVFVRNRGFLVPQAELRPSDPSALAHFGRAVAVRGDTVAVGAPDAPGGGAVYVFVRTRGVWAQTQKLTPSNPVAGDLFGAAVDLAGADLASGRIVVGAPGRDGGTGSVFLFDRNGTNWTETAALRPASVAPGGPSEQFGSAVTISGSNLAAAAAGTGTAYAGSLAGAQWTEEAALAVAAGGGAALPWSVALDGDTLAFGAAGDDTNATNSGSVSIFTRSAGVWSPVVKLHAAAPAAGAGFGGAVALAGGVLVAGAAGEATGGSGAGGVHVFALRGSVWTADRRVAAPGVAALDAFGTAIALTPDGIVAGAPGRVAGTVFALGALPDQKLLAAGGAAANEFGRSVAIDGDTALVGAPLGDDLGANFGSVHVLVRTGFVWTRQATLTAADGAAGDAFGFAVALSGGTALVGAHAGPGAIADSGAAYVFVRSGTSWTQEAKLVAAVGVSGALFGHAVALEGDTALVGADGDDGQAAKSGAAYVFVRAGTVWTRQAKLVAGDGEPNDAFGTSVALDGDDLVVGAINDDDKGTDSGSAYVFVRSGSTWTQQAKLLDPAGFGGDLLGASVAISGDTALVGAHRDDDGLTNSGTVHEFVRSSGNWTRRSKLRALDAAANESFGSCVALSGDTALVGASDEDRTSLTNAGAVYVFVRSGIGWVQKDKLTAADAAGFDAFGVAVAISRETALIGVHLDDDAGTDSGSAWIRALDLSAWSGRASVTASDAAASDRFGYAVALSGGTAVFGAPDDDHDTTSIVTSPGSAYVFVRSGSSWVEEARLASPDAVQFERLGAAVALEGDTALLGAPSGRVANVQTGSAEVFVRSGTAWTHQAKLAADDGAPGDSFGSSCALSGDTAIVGSPTDDDLGTNSGSAYVFVRSAGTWAQQAKLVPTDLASPYQFGISVGLDGDTVVVGAPRDDDRGVESGSAYVFVRSGTAWTQQAKLTALDGAAGDRFGTSVALSGDAVIVGAPEDDHGGGSGAGGAYVFRRSGTTWTQHAKLTASDGADGARFGFAVAIDGGNAVVGAPGPPENDPGAAYHFVQSGAGWTEIARLQNPRTTLTADFGSAVAVSGEAALVGANSDDTAASLAGAAHVYGWTPDASPLGASAVVPAEWTAGVPLDVALTSSGGDAPAQWRVVAGALPAGAFVDSAGARISGSPSASGDFAFTIECSDACVRTFTFAATLHVNAAPRIVLAALPPAATGRRYAAALGRTGGTGSFAYELAAGGGSGLALDAATGLLSGTPGANGTFTLTVRGADALGGAAPGTEFTVVVGDRLDVAARGSAKQTISQTGGPAFRTFDALAGSTLDVRARVPKGSPPPTFVLIDPTGAPVDPGLALKVTKKGAQIRKLPLARTGRYALIVRPGTGAPAGEISLSVTLRPGRKSVQPIALTTGGTTPIAIAALPGSKVTCRVAAAKGQVVAPRVVSLAGPAGVPIPTSPVIESAKSASFSFTAALGGNSTLVLGTRDGTSGGAVVTVTIRPPKGYGFVVPDPE